jgi:hypothetical protein
MKITLEQLRSIISEAITVASLGQSPMTPIGAGPTYPNPPFETRKLKKKKKNKRNSN